MTWARTLLTAGLLPLGALVASAEDACPVRKEATVVESKVSGRETLPDHVSSAEIQACLIAAKDVLAQPEAFVLVDVREPRETAHVRIPAALNLRVENLDTSPFLFKDERIPVLVGDGRDALRLTSLCVGRRKNGRGALKVLAGGVRAWYREHGQVVGDTTTLDRPQVVSSEVVREFTRSDSVWLLVDSPTRFPDPTVSRLIAIQSVAPHTLTGRLRHQADASGPTAIIVMLDSDDALPQWQRAFLTADLPEPMFHIEGLNAYAEWTRQQTLVTQSAGKSLGVGCRWN